MSFEALYIGKVLYDWDFTLFEQCETHSQLIETETILPHRLKTFYPLNLNEKEEYLLLFILAYPIYERQTINYERILAQS